MTNQKILTKAIEKAIAGGWSGDWSGSGIVKLSVGGDFMTKALAHYADIVFSHQFAKALWGEGPVISRRVPHSPFADDPDPDAIIITAPAWEHHLQQMVVADDPIRYLGDNI